MPLKENPLKIILLQIFLFTAVIFTSFHSFADEPLFGYVYTTDLQPQGKYEIEQWFTDREGQASGHFHHLDMSTELEYGLTNNFQIAFYFNYMYANESANSVRGLTEGIEVPYDHNSATPYSQARIDGFSIEAIYRLLSPYTDPIGLAFYIEPEWGFYESGVETRLIVQKNYFEDQLVLAFNFWLDFDREQDSNLGGPTGDVTPGATATSATYSTATYAEFDLGASYRVASNWFVGLEFRNHNEFRGISLDRGDQDHTAFFMGPNVHYASEHFFITLSVLKQLGAFAYTADQQAQVQNGLLYGDEHTTWDGIRVKVGFPL
jgi:hypothetical protein